MVKYMVPDVDGTLPDGGIYNVWESFHSGLESGLTIDKNARWIYTYDYAPGSVWEKWRDSDKEPEWIGKEAEAVAKRVRKDLPCFILLADSHFTFNGTWDDTAASLRALSSMIPIKGMIHLGDLTDGMLTAEKTRKIERKAFSDMSEAGAPVYIVPGNHDYNYFRGNPEVKYPDAPQYYVDIPEQMLRLIFIDSFDPKEAVRYGFTDYCVHWLDSVLDLMPEGFQAIIFSHVPPLVRLQAWTNDIRNRERLIEVLDRYADRILAFINGHNHCDHLFNDLHNGQFPILSINCAKCEYFLAHKPEGAVVPYRRLGDRTQESFDIMQVDADKNEIYFTRFGAGQDRKVTDHKAVWI